MIRGRNWKSAEPLCPATANKAPQLSFGNRKKPRAATALTIFAVVAIVASASPFSLQRPLDGVSVRVDGEGYLRLSRDGKPAYTKKADFLVVGGRLVSATGDPPLPSISVPADARQLSVDLEGNVVAQRSSTTESIGRLVLALFEPGTDLVEREGMVVTESRPKLGNPGEGMNGVIRFEPYRGGSKLRTLPSQNTGAGTSGQAQGTTPLPVRDPVKTPDDLNAHKAAPSTQSSQEPKQSIPTKAPSVRVTAVTAAEVAAEKTFLGDVATIEGDAPNLDLYRRVELGESPSPDGQRSYDRARILARIRGAGLNADDLEIVMSSPMITVTRKGQPIAFNQFNQVAIKAIYESPGIATHYLPAATAGPDFMAPAGKVTLVVEAISGINTPVATVKVAVYVGTKRVDARTMTFNAKAG